MVRQRTVRLGTGLDVKLPQGILRVVPGRGGLPVVSFHDDADAAARVTSQLVKAGSPGRHPLPATLQLRQRLRRDHAGPGLRATGDYVRYLVARGFTLDSARQTAHREIRSAKSPRPPKLAWRTVSRKKRP
jgi:hypothetical protein